MPIMTRTSKAWAGCRWTPKGRFAFTTIKPGSVAGPEGQPQAPHLVVLVFMRGLLRAASARVYFSDAPGNADDPILALVPAERRATLIAQAQGNGRVPLGRAHAGRAGNRVLRLLMPACTRGLTSRG